MTPFRLHVRETGGYLLYYDKEDTPWFLDEDEIEALYDFLRFEWHGDDPYAHHGEDT